jgi:predicted permease
MRDLRFAWRLLLRNPLPSFVIVASLALGIGGAASVFTVLNALVLRSLPVARADQLSYAERHQPNGTRHRFSWPQIQDAVAEIGSRAETAAMSELGAMQVRTASDVTGDRAMVQLVSGEYFDVLRERAQIGRVLVRDDNRESAPPVAVISDSYWQRRFNRARSAMGETLLVNGAAVTVVGVTAPGFQGTTIGFRGADLWIPLVLQPSVHYASNSSSHGTGDTSKPWPPQRHVEWLRLLLRVPDSSDQRAIASAVEVVLAREARDERESPDGDRTPPSVTLTSAARGISGTRSQLSAPLYVLLGMTGLLLTIASANVASLLLARALNREQEMAIRLSMGAGRRRLIRQLLVESLLLSGTATAAGLLVAAWGRELLVRLFVPAGTTIVELDTSFDLRVLLFTCAIGLATGIACGIAPAIRGTRAQLADTLKLQGRGAASQTGRRALLGRSFVAAQIALCVVLLVLSGLLAATLRHLTRAEIGFDRDHLLVARIDMGSLGLQADARDALIHRVLDRARAIPGVASASMSFNGPLANSAWASSMVLEGYTARRGEQLIMSEELVTSDYIKTVGLRLLAGRDFTRADESRDSKATIVNLSAARRFFGSPQNAIGRRWAYDNINQDAFTIVGVVEDAKYLELREKTPNMAYHPFAAFLEQAPAGLELRTAGDPGALIPTVQRALKESIPEVPVVEIMPFKERVARAASAERLVANLTNGFGVLALLLAAVGLYGTLSYAVSRRTGELGLRMALGADRRTVVRLVMREAVLLVIVGAAVGLPLAFFAARGLKTLLYDVAPLEPVIYATGILVLAAISLTAAYLPARRAAAIDPMAAVREA